MAKLLVWLPAGGLGIMLLVMLGYAFVGGRRVPGFPSGDRPGLVLVLEDYEEQVEMLVRWLEFRRRWWGSQVELTIAPAVAVGDTPAILSRLHKEGNFQIATDRTLLEACGNNTVIRLAGNEPIPWGELAGKLQGKQEIPA